MTFFIQPCKIITHLNSMITRSTITLALFFTTLFAFGQSGKQKIHPLVIKFTSYGTGVPDKKPVIDFIDSFKRKNKIKKIKIDTVGPMGKEGEYGLALLLTELTKKQKKLFIREIKMVSKRAGDRGEIQYEENVSIGGTKSPVHGKLQPIKIE